METIKWPASPLDEGRVFSGEILWMPGYALDALTLALAASHVLESWYTVPRLLFTSPEGQSGKSTALDLVHMLGDNTWDATGATSYSIRSKFNERTKPFAAVDEISMVFGLSGLRGENNDLAKMMRVGYRRKAVISMSVDRSSVDVSVFCFMAFAGLKTAVPHDIWTRCIPFAMVPKPSNITMARDSLDPDTEAEAAVFKMALHAYMKTLQPYIKRLQRSFKRPHPKFTDRKDQIWRAVYLTAKAADMYELDQWKLACEAAEEEGTDLPERPHCTWTERAMTAFKTMALDSSDLPTLTSPQRMLRDVAEWFRESGEEFAFAGDLLLMLRDSNSEELWDVLTDRKMELLMKQALGESTAKTVGTRRARGFYAAPVLKAWEKLEASFYAAMEAEEPEPSLFDEIEVTEDTVVTQVFRDEGKDEHFLSTVNPPCEEDGNQRLAAARRRKVQTAAGQGDDKFLLKNIKGR